MLAVREVYDDWSAQRGTVTIERTDTVGTSPAHGLPEDDLAKRYAVAGKMLIARIKTWFVFPEWFYLNEPVNTITEPRHTPGGLSSQYSSVGHYDVADDEAIVLDRAARRRAVPGVPARQPLVHLTGLHPPPDVAQRPPGPGRPGRQLIRLVIAEQDPGVANWVERLGHDRGYLQFRWQRLVEAPITEGPTLQIVRCAELPRRAALLRLQHRHARAVG